MVAFDRTGRRRWTYRFEAGAGAAGPPVVAGDVVVIARTDGHMDAVTGLWPTPVGAGARDIAAERRGRARHPCAGVARRSARRHVAERSVRAYDVHSRRQRWAFGDGPADAVAFGIRVCGDQLCGPCPTPTARSSCSTPTPGGSAGGRPMAVSSTGRRRPLRRRSTRRPARRSRAFDIHPRDPPPDSGVPRRRPLKGPNADVRLQHAAPIPPGGCSPSPPASS